MPRGDIATVSTVSLLCKAGVVAESHGPGFFLRGWAIWDQFQKVCPVVLVWWLFYRSGRHDEEAGGE